MEISDATSQLCDPRHGDDGGDACGTRPDLRPELSGLPASLPGLERLLFRMRLHLDPPMPDVRLRPRCPMHRQSVLRGAEAKGAEAEAGVLRWKGLRKLT